MTNWKHEEGDVGEIYMESDVGEIYMANIGVSPPAGLTFDEWHWPSFHYGQFLYEAIIGVDNYEEWLLKKYKAYQA